MNLPCIELSLNMSFLSRLFEFLRIANTPPSATPVAFNESLNPSEINKLESNTTSESSSTGISPVKTNAFISPSCLTQDCSYTPVIFDETPDQAIDFAYKVNWFAIASNNSSLVIEALQPNAYQVANWESGLAVAIPSLNKQDKRNWIFVSPPLEGWVLVVGTSLPYPVMHTEDRHDGIGQKFDKLAQRLAQKFDDVQFFGSYRVVGFIAWARFLRGEMVRVFSFGEGLYANLGKQTPEEVLLKLPCLDGLNLSEAEDKIFTFIGEDEDEDSPENGVFLDEIGVIEMAELWSINPLNNSFTEGQPATGFVFELDQLHL